MNNFNFIDVKERNEWQKTIEKEYDYYPGQSWVYGKIQSLITNRNIYLLSFNKNYNNYFCPFYSNKYNNYKYLYTPNGYTGFNKFLEIEILNYLKKEFKDKEIITTYITNNPFCNITNKNEFMNYKNDAFIISLEEDREVIFKKFKLSLRKKIKKSKELKPIVLHRSEIKIEDFLHLYNKTIRRLNIPDNIILSKKAIEFILFEKENIEINAISIKNKIVSLSVFILSNNYSDYYINLSEDNYNFLTGFLIYEMINNLKHLNVKFLNLGGGISADDSLEQFKKSFNCLTKPFYEFKLINNEDIYRGLPTLNNNNLFPKFLLTK